jgi:16S rRNA (guanine966-N2)-methyltransferase
MRIISGTLKGKPIDFLKNMNTRPLKNSVRENIFNILEHSNFIKVKIENSNILDLYSGIGSFGIECLSRRARKITFIEQDVNASNILKQNLTNLSVVDKSIIYADKIENILNRNIMEKYDIFFLDPPFTDYEFINNLEIIKKRKIFSKNHIIIIHRENKSKDKLESYMKTIQTKKYGRSKIIFGTFN